MAENALYISSVEHIKPSIFELVAQESLLNTLNPSYNLLCKILKIKCRQKLSWFFNYQEEWFLFINLLLQTHYMRLFKGSFSEAFYGLKRIPLKNESNKLSRYSMTMSLFCIVGLPYLSVKLKNFIESYQLKEEMINITTDEKKKIRLMLIAYKSTCTVNEILKFYYLLRYISGFSEIHSPLLKLSGVKLVHHNIDVPSWKELITDYFSNKKRISKIVLPVTYKFLSQILEISAFTIQFLSWWHSDEIKTKLNTLPIPPALNPERNVKNLCPICHQKRKVEVVLQSSGYVYCFRCIKEELQKTGKCPVTNLPASPEHLVRIYSVK
ncbi:hypothetical protein O3M35_008275 [Rhynocoris fuscipes]|uniref:Peroxisome assembly protein 12 n=1 Tax=Rhynocoris fuscipes TaxID=488301 RepID=A0AAW1D8C9_9HEMI